MIQRILIPAATTALSLGFAMFATQDQPDIKAKPAQPQTKGYAAVAATAAKAEDSGDALADVYERLRTLRVGTAATATRFAFNVIGSLPAFVLDGTTNGKTATATAPMSLYGATTISAGSTFVINGQTCLVLGPSFTNNGTLTGTADGTRFYFLGGNGPTTYAGTGTVTAPLLAFEVDNVAGVTIAPSVNPVVAARVNLFSGGVTGAGKLTLGNGGATSATVQLGVTGATQAVSGFDAPPVFNPGSGGVMLFYAPELTGRTTGNEMPASRTLNTLSITNPNPITIAGGDVTVNGTAAGALALGSARVVTGSNTLFFNSAAGTVTRSTGYVDGNFRKSFSAAASKVFEVGTANGYSPVTVNATAGTFPANVSVAARQGTAPFLSATPNALARYWTLAGSSVTASLTFTYLASDVIGNAASYSFFKNVAGAVTAIAPSTTPTSTSATLNGVTALAADWTLAQPAPAIAVADGGTALVDGNSTADLGSSPVGTGVARTFTVTNPGSANLLLGAIIVDGANAGDFVPSALGSTTVTPGGSTSFTVTFTPSFVGAAGAAIHLASNVSGATNPFDFALAGTGSGTAPLITSASSTIFQLGAASAFQVMASGSPAPTFSATGALPGGVGFSSAGLLSGLPAAGGSFSLSITASNGVAPSATQSFTLIVNRPPVANPDTLSTRRNTPATLSLTRLLANDTDPDGDPRTVSSIAAASSQGGTITSNGTSLTYTPPTTPANFTGADAFSYTISDGRGGSATGTVNVTVTPGDQALRTVSITMSGGAITVVFAGIPGDAYQVQTQDTMNGPWANAGLPLPADAQGQVMFGDPSPPSSRFYRAIAP